MDEKLAKTVKELPPDTPIGGYLKLTRESLTDRLNPVLPVVRVIPAGTILRVVDLVGMYSFNGVFDGYLYVCKTLDAGHQITVEDWEVADPHPLELLALEAHDQE